MVFEKDEAYNRLVHVNKCFVIWDSYSGHKLEKFKELASQEKIDEEYIQIFVKEYLEVI